ncbi:hiran domain protein [Winogradskyella sp. J14-2]|uniref:HIRAN domain-containing protein n=1 Tax=Winogradskyella sp. J14-2 TaxID=1936080 RepID=UPI000972B3DD|nr:HIRAN domain-containing protein [Winogradskyella sp. J14-2]APY07256.1 hiran domain protein [Winogradskyella sp. J14-2]
MKRLDFIKAFGLGSTGLVIPQTNFAQKPIKIYDNYIKGLTHYDLNKVKKQMSVGDALLLRRERENIYDSFAVAVFYDTKKLGYLPAYENVVISNLLEQGVKLNGFVSKLNLQDVYQAVSIEIYANIVVESPSMIQTDLLEHRADDAIDKYRKGPFF